MSPVVEAADALRAALAAVDGVRFYRDLSASLDPPAALLGPPRLTWEALCPEPTSATFLVYLVVTADDRSVERLWDLIEAVTLALDEVTDAVVMEANPSTWPSGATELPAYEITVDYAL